MADQARWFKLWCSAPADNHRLQELPPAGALGSGPPSAAHTKTHGTRGRVTVSACNHVLAAEMGVGTDALMATIAMAPHVQIQESHSVNGTFTVTWQNWLKYQEDSTIAKRVTRLRDKRRGEENKTRGENTTSSRAAQREMACRRNRLPEREGRPELPEGREHTPAHHGPPRGWCHRGELPRRHCPEGAGVAWHRDGEVPPTRDPLQPHQV